MSKKVLIIGGSSFTGRVFCIQMSKNSDYELHVVNRGQFPLNLEGVKEYKSDRHNAMMIARMLPKEPFEVMIDFCAYNPGESSSILGALKGRIKHYIVFSTVSVYEPYNHEMKSEGDTIYSKSEGDKVTEYIYNKVLIEQETINTCKAFGIPYTILRPTFIYGPFNYAARESYFIELIARGHVVPVPSDTTSHFNMVYVFDIARILEICIGNEKSFNEIFNLSAPEEITYIFMLESFEKFNGGPYMTKSITVEKVLETNLPLPFPLTEDELYSGKKFADTFDFTYTPFAEGMERTFKIFYSLFTT